MQAKKLAALFRGPFRPVPPGLSGRLSDLLAALFREFFRSGGIAFLAAESAERHSRRILLRRLLPGGGMVIPQGVTMLQS